LENNSEQKRQLLNRLLPRKKIIMELEQRNNGGTTKRSSIQPLKKPTANGNTYSRAGTAELKPYSRGPRKIISPIFFPFTAKKMALAIGQQRSILKIQNPTATLI
jgi:hypothetical protein